MTTNNDNYNITMKDDNCDVTADKNNNVTAVKNNMTAS